MNQQQAFDLTVKWLARQGHAAMNIIGNCVYRGEGGTRCAVGIHIPDDVYNLDMDYGIDGDSSVHSLIKGWGNVIPSYIIEYQSMFDDLQRAHDNNNWMKEWTKTTAHRRVMHEALSGIAVKYSLSTTVLDDCFGPQ